jgi:hypothetical protein
MHLPGQAWLDSLESTSTEQLLASCGDSRHAIREDGRNRYANRYRPEPGLVTLGSCTASTLSRGAYLAAEQMHGWLAALEREWRPHAIDDVCEQVRLELLSHVVPYVQPTPAVVLTPSGTDAEFIPLLAMLSRHQHITNILVGPGEAGSGTAMAAAGLHFDPMTPAGRVVEVGTAVESGTDRRVETVTVAIRDSAGTPRETAAIDAEVADVVRSRVGAGRGVLLHVIAHSKTGVHAPSLTAVHDLVASNPAHVDVVIDAAQGRFSRSGLHDVLTRGYMVITTGSKFFGGPPFAGAVIVPRASEAALAANDIPPGFADYLAPSMLPRPWQAARASLPEWHNVGLALRWWAALTQVKAYYSVPSRLRFDVLRTLQVEVPRRLAASPHLVTTTVPATIDEAVPQRLLESNVTVFSFLCRAGDSGFLDQDELSQVRAAVRDPWPAAHRFADATDSVRPVCAEIGQPVPVGPDKGEPAYLRLAIGAREIVRACRGGRSPEVGLDHLLDDIDRTVTRLDDAVMRRALEGA